jgi:hypothetical protein
MTRSDPTRPKKMINHELIRATAANKAGDPRSTREARRRTPRLASRARTIGLRKRPKQ